MEFLNTVRFFMVFSFCLVLVGFGSEIFKTFYGKNSPAELQKQVETLTEENKKLKNANDVYAASLGEVWTIKGEYNTDPDPPVQSAGEIEVTAHPPVVEVDSATNTFVTKIFVTKRADGSSTFPRLQIARQVKREVCTIKFEAAQNKITDTGNMQGKITATGDIIPIKSTSTNHEIEILKPIDLASFGPRESSKTTKSVITNIGEKGTNESH